MVISSYKVLVSLNLTDLCHEFLGVSDHLKIITLTRASVVRKESYVFILYISVLRDRKFSVHHGSWLGVGWGGDEGWGLGGGDWW